VLQAETALFGIKVIVVEPSGFKTDWAGSSPKTASGAPSAPAPAGRLHSAFSSGTLSWHSPQGGKTQADQR
jgi:hypothetical protein